MDTALSEFKSHISAIAVDLRNVIMALLRNRRMSESDRRRVSEQCWLTLHDNSEFNLKIAFDSYTVGWET